MRVAVVGVVVATMSALAPVPAQAHDPHIPSVDPMEPEIGQHDFEKGSKHGSPLDALPEHITLLDIDLPDGRAPMRADWSPDGKRLIFLDDPIGNVWEFDLASGKARNLTGPHLPGGVLRAHHLSNGDLVLCAPVARDPVNPEGDRFKGTLWVMTRPLGRRPPVQLGEQPDLDAEASHDRRQEEPVGADLVDEVIERSGGRPHDDRVGERQADGAEPPDPGAPQPGREPVRCHRLPASSGRNARPPP